MGFHLLREDCLHDETLTAPDLSLIWYPGGLKSEVASGEQPGSIVMKGPGFYGVPPARPGQEAAGSILRKQVWKI